ncbi:MAG: thiol reductase thioredoxin [Bacteroidales bacterium]|nr:thiol reductase thioredoxin [Bacteroidales bacterium]MBN2818536.1 thiol reductase thioredoxin [Bacteroidales bacterium]
MKKFAILLLVAAIGTLSCNSNDGSNPNDSKTEKTKTVPSSEPTVLAGGEPIHLTKQEFLDNIMDYESNPQEWIYKGELPGLIDFYADWCRPCKITSPILDELAAEYAGQINIYKVNVDKERELAGVFGVQSIPTFLFMPTKGNPTISSGIAQTPEQTKEMFKTQIEQILLKK